MTKLEEKLIELGYEECKISHNDLKKYKKEYNDYINIYLYYDLYDKKFTNWKVKPYADINDQSVLDDLQQAYNEMEKDLEALRNVED